MKNGKRPDKGWLGVSIAKYAGNSTIAKYNWVVEVSEGSPASKAGIKSLRIMDSGVVEWGDAIVAIAGNTVRTYEELVSEIGDRVIGEQVALTLETIDGERRVVCVALLWGPCGP